MTKKIVAMAMSGGVDSSVSALLLQQQGYKVIGLTMRLWRDEAQKQDYTAEKDAAAVCQILGIEHHVVDYTKIFRETVVANFLDEYALGRTPNPCVYCNKKIKFGALYQEAERLGADLLSTGHYVRLAEDDNGIRHIRRAAYLPKDQSYVLYHLNQEILHHVIFPLGEYNKEEAREMAKEHNLPVFAKKDSQDLCFIPDNDHDSFLSRYSLRKDRPGNFVDGQGHILGKHKGLSHYTAGQRKGLGIAAAEPFFVLGLNVEKNQVILGFGKDANCFGLRANQMVFADGSTLVNPLPCAIKIRYNAKLMEAVVNPPNEQGEAQVIFSGPLRGIAPGQSVVFYQGDICLGGATILGPLN